MAFAGGFGGAVKRLITRGQTPVPAEAGKEAALMTMQPVVIFTIKAELTLTRHASCKLLHTSSRTTADLL